MLIRSENIIKILPIIRLELYKKESNFLIPTNLLNEVLILFKNHFKYQYKMLTCISCVDYPENFYRFQIVYELLSLKFNSRLRLKVLVDELVPVNSIEKIFSGSSWWECEIWDMFGVFFVNQNKLTRLLTDYGFQGYGRPTGIVDFSLLACDVIWVFVIVLIY
jgi:NADH:ubiquinone oxidoreductase subunit C